MDTCKNMGWSPKPPLRLSPPSLSLTSFSLSRPDAALCDPADPIDPVDLNCSCCMGGMLQPRPMQMHTTRRSRYTGRGALGAAHGGCTRQHIVEQSSATSTGGPSQEGGKGKGESTHLGANHPPSMSAGVAAGHTALRGTDGGRPCSKPWMTCTTSQMPFC